MMENDERNKLIEKMKENYNDTIESGIGVSIDKSLEIRDYITEIDDCEKCDKKGCKISEKLNLFINKEGWNDVDKYFASFLYGISVGGKIALSHVVGVGVCEEPDTGGYIG